MIMKNTPSYMSKSKPKQKHVFINKFMKNIKIKNLEIKQLNHGNVSK